MNGPSPSRATLARRATADLSWYFHHFLCGFCYYFPLVLLFLLPLVLMPRSIGRKYGTHNLFFHDNSWFQFLGGFALGIYWATILFIGYLLHLRDLRERRTGDEADDVDVGLTGYCVRRLLAGLRWWFRFPPAGKRLAWASRVGGTALLLGVLFHVLFGSGVRTYLAFATCAFLLGWLVHAPVPGPDSFLCYCYRVVSCLFVTAAIFAFVMIASIFLFGVISTQQLKGAPDGDGKADQLRLAATQAATLVGSRSPNALTSVAAAGCVTVSSRNYGRAWNTYFQLPTGVLASWFVLGGLCLQWTRERALFASLLLLGAVFFLFSWLLWLPHTRSQG